MVLDSATLPLTDRLVPQIRAFLAALSRTAVCSIDASENELRFWKETLPALVERRRDWKHRLLREYKVESRIPVSVQNGQSALCSCGNGTLPPNYLCGIPRWDIASKYAVRLSISPVFSIPFVDLPERLD